MKEKIHVVLVEPKDNLNIGSVARAMANLGFSNLHLVAPPHLDIEKACVTACWAGDLLRNAKIRKSLVEALGPMELVVGFSAKGGRNRPAPIELSKWAEKFTTDPIPMTALLFGPEDSGLNAEQIAQCRDVIRIPSSDTYPAFNLAQSVLLAMYELCRNTPDSSINTDRNLPTWDQFRQLDALVERVLSVTGFYGKGTPEGLQKLVQNLLRRTNPDEREMRVLLGVFGTIDGVLSGRIPNSLG